MNDKQMNKEYQRRNVLGLAAAPFFSPLDIDNEDSWYRNTSVGETLYQQDFEDFSLGEDPPGWVFFGNEMNEYHGVVNSTSISGSKSYKVKGIPDGCLECVAYKKVPLPGNEIIRFRGAAKPTTKGKKGCHSKQGAITINTDKGEVGEIYSNNILLLKFTTGGELIASDGTRLQSYEPNSWYFFDIIYDRSGDEVIMKYAINGGSIKEITRQPSDFEKELSYLSIQSSDFSFYVDSLSITSYRNLLLATNSYPDQPVEKSGKSGPYGIPIELWKLAKVTATIGGILTIYKFIQRRRSESPSTNGT